MKTSCLKINQFLKILKVSILFTCFFWLKSFAFNETFFKNMILKLFTIENVESKSPSIEEISNKIFKRTYGLDDRKLKKIKFLEYKLSYLTYYFYKVDKKRFLHKYYFSKLVRYFPDSIFVAQFNAWYFNLFKKFYIKPKSNVVYYMEVDDIKRNLNTLKKFFSRYDIAAVLVGKLDFSTFKKIVKKLKLSEYYWLAKWFLVRGNRKKALRFLSRFKNNTAEYYKFIIFPNKKYAMAFLRDVNIKRFDKNKIRKVFRWILRNPYLLTSKEFDFLNKFKFLDSYEYSRALVLRLLMKKKLEEALPLLYKLKPDRELIFWLAKNGVSKAKRLLNKKRDFFWVIYSERNFKIFQNMISEFNVEKRNYVLSKYAYQLRKILNMANYKNYRIFQKYGLKFLAEYELQKLNRKLNKLQRAILYRYMYNNSKYRECYLINKLRLNRDLGYIELANRYSKIYKVPAALILSIMKVESAFNEEAFSVASAYGLMQLTLPTARWLAKKLKINIKKIKYPDCNIKMGTYYLKYLMRKTNLIIGIAAYNAGLGNVRKYNWQDFYFKYPVNETKKYVKKVINVMLDILKRR